MRIRAGSAATLTATFVGDDEETPLVAASATVTVTDDTGAVAITARAAAGPDANNAWTFNTTVADALPLGQYIATWTANTGVTAVTRFEVVGGFIFTVAEVRAMSADLADKTRFPADSIKKLRDAIEAEFERIAGRSFTPRARWFPVEPDDTASVLAECADISAILKAQVDGLAADITTWRVGPDSLIYSPTALSSDSVVSVKLSYGFAIVPDDIKRVAVLRLRSLFASPNSGIPERATHVVSPDGGQFVLATPGMGRWKTGIPEVDAVLSGYSFDVLSSVD